MMVADAAVSFAVEKLGNLLIEKAVFLIAVKGEVEWLRDELKSMQGFLKDAAKKQSDNEDIRNWISAVRNVAHDAEDAIELFVLKVQSEELKKRYGCFPNHLYHLNKVGKQIASIRQKLKDIQDRRVRYKIQGDEREEASTRMTAQERIEGRRRVAYWKPNQDVVGLEEDVKLILGKAVFEKSQGPSVSAILGIGGMGKSTLASEIYNHPEVAVTGGFEFREWVVVSSEFNPEDIMKQILQKLGISNDELKRLGSTKNKVGRQEALKKEVHQRLSGKRYFIVLDDVWEAEHWESMSTAFPADGDKGSRLLLTSRNPVITMNSGYVHHMKPLDAHESWDLFMRKAFGGNTGTDICPKELKEVGEEIVKKCGGLPLAISVVGGLLAKKTPSKSEWGRVHKQMKSHLDIYPSSSSGDLNIIGAILELSYHNLPLELKTCFLCLGFFEEDVVIKVKELVHIWVAQGLVAQEVEGEEVRMEDVARDYLNELIGRNMVQVKEMRYDGTVKTCQMHDLLRDLSIGKAKVEIDFEVLREGDNSSHQSLAKPRHRAIHFNEETNFVYSTNRNQHLCSLFVHYYGEGWGQDISGIPSSYWKSFEILRDLHLGNTIIFQVLPTVIGELTGLRSLSMRYDGNVVTSSRKSRLQLSWEKLKNLTVGEKVPRLPRSWAKLKNLEVLRLWGLFFFLHGVIKIDKVILKMESLRHLYLCVESDEVGLRYMRNLQTLQSFRVESSHDVWKIQGMSRVSKLGIDLSNSNKTPNDLFKWLSSLENLFHLTLIVSESSIDLEGLITLHLLTYLKLRLKHVRGISIVGYVKLPAYFPPYLAHLTLSEMRLEEDPMPILEKLPNLVSLKLSEIWLDGIIMVITSGGFPTLKLLRIQHISCICKMEINEESAMPELNQFIITKCPSLDVENVPERIKSAMIIQLH